MKGSKEGFKKEAKKRDELGVSHSHFQAFFAFQPFFFFPDLGLKTVFNGFQFLSPVFFSSC